MVCKNIANLSNHKIVGFCEMAQKCAFLKLSIGSALKALLLMPFAIIINSHKIIALTPIVQRRLEPITLVVGMSPSLQIQVTWHCWCHQFACTLSPSGF